MLINMHARMPSIDRSSQVPPPYGASLHRHIDRSMDWDRTTSIYLTHPDSPPNPFHSDSVVPLRMAAMERAATVTSHPCGSSSSSSNSGSRREGGEPRPPLSSSSTISHAPRSHGHHSSHDAAAAAGGASSSSARPDELLGRSQVFAQLRHGHIQNRMGGPARFALATPRNWQLQQQPEDGGVAVEAEAGDDGGDDEGGDDEAAGRRHHTGHPAVVFKQAGAGAGVLSPRHGEGDGACVGAWMVCLGWMWH